MNTAKVYYINDYSKVAKSTVDNPDVYTAKITDAGDSLNSKDRMDTSTLYGDVYNNISYIPRVLALLQEGRELLASSSNSLKSGDEVSSDNDIQHFLALLPELFCCRSIGDGFASIINSIYNAIVNQSEIGLLSESQISTILSLVKQLQLEPFLEFDEVIDLIFLLDAVGLDIEPKHLNKLSEILCGE
jgi:hypothetical protein